MRYELLPCPCCGLVPTMVEFAFTWRECSPLYMVVCPGSDVCVCSLEHPTHDSTEECEMDWNLARIMEGEEV